MDEWGTFAKKGISNKSATTLPKRYKQTGSSIQRRGGKHLSYPNGTIRSQNSTIGRKSVISSISLNSKSSSQPGFRQINGISDNDRSLTNKISGYSDSDNGHNFLLKNKKHMNGFIFNSTPKLSRDNTLEASISNFSIEFQDDKVKFKPGDEINGTVLMELWCGMLFRCVELIIEGRGSLIHHPFSPSNRPIEEIYMEHKIYLISPPDGELFVSFEAGKYASDFTFKLPMDIPASLRQVDLGGGYKFSITYSATASICANADSRHKNLMAVIKKTRCDFLVASSDWTSLPDAFEPINCDGELTLSCSPFSNAPKPLWMSVDRSIYPIGDKINILLETTANRIKSVCVELNQKVTFYSQVTRQVTRNIYRRTFCDKLTKTNELDSKLYTFRHSLHVPNIIPSLIPLCRVIKIKYIIKITIKFKHLGGQLVANMPVIITNPSETERSVGNKATIPLFNKPITKLNLTPFALYDKDYDNSDTASVISSVSSKFTDLKRISKKHPLVTATYHRGGQNCCFNCCGITSNR